MTLKSEERVELEQFRAEAETNRVIGKYILVAMIVALVAFFGAVYKADAFIDGGINVTKMVRYYSKK